MAEIRRLDGSDVQIDAPKRNQAVAELLAELVEANDRGEIKAITGIYILPSGAWREFWRSPLNKEGVAWDLALLGGLTMLQGQMCQATKDAPPLEEDDGA